MPSLLLAESGSTKTDWCYLKKGEQPRFFKTSGINPYLQTRETIAHLIREELPPAATDIAPKEIHFYGAGAGNKKKQAEVTEALGDVFGARKIRVQGDMMAAARALCGEERGVVSILGTGSNSCYYDGEKIKEQHASLGYIAGDEGSGNHMGKRVLQHYAYHTFDAELMADFEQHWGDDVAAITHRLYREAFPNRQLAEFVSLLARNRGHFMVENIIEDCLSDFFGMHIMKYRQSWKHPLYFAGSVAWEFRDVIESLCAQSELELGGIVKSPMEGLMKWHKKAM